jgi:hypothetical protein
VLMVVVVPILRHAAPKYPLPPHLRAGISTSSALAPNKQG